MNSNRVCQSLWAVSILGLSSLWSGSAAIAISTQGDAQSLAQSTETVLVEDADVVPDDGSVVGYEPEMEKPQPLGEFREALLQSAGATARQIEQPGFRMEALADLSGSYAQLGRTDLAEATASEVLAIMDQSNLDIDDVYSLLHVARVYRHQLNNIAQLDAVLLQVIALIETTPEVSDTAWMLLGSIADEYAFVGEYAKARSVIDMIASANNRIYAVHGMTPALEINAPEEDKATIAALFPELGYTPDDGDYLSYYPTSEQQSFTVWMDQINEFLREAQISPPSEASLSTFFEQQLAALDAFSDTIYQPAGHITLAAVWIFDLADTEQALPLLEIAMEKLEQLDDPSIPFDFDSYNLQPREGNYELGYYIGALLVVIGELEQGFLQLQEAGNPSEPVATRTDKRLTMLLEAPEVLFEQDRQNMIPAVLAEAESATELAETPERYWIEIASMYGAIGDLENSKRLLQAVIEALNRRQGPFSLEDARIAQMLANFLLVDKTTEEIVELSKTIENQWILTEFVSSLFRKEQDESAFAVFDLLTSPVVRAETLVQMSKDYEYYREDTATAFEFASRAMAIVQSPAYGEDTYFDMRLEQSIAAGNSGDGLRDYIIEAYLIELIKDAIFSGAGDEYSLNIVRLIEDESIRTHIMRRYFPAEMGTDEAITNGSLDSYTLRAVVAKAVREENFQTAVAAVAAMDSFYEQSEMLREIAVHHVNNSTILEENMRLMLNRL